MRCSDDQASAKQGEQTMFLAELSYGGEVSVAADMKKNYSSHRHDRRPRFLFPFRA